MYLMPLNLSLKQCLNSKFCYMYIATIKKYCQEKKNPEEANFNSVI